MKQVQDLIRFLPRSVAWSDISQFDRFDERLGAVNVSHGAIMDVTDGHVALSTDQSPTDDELVAWAWLIRPDLQEQIIPAASSELREAIAYYRNRIP
jgi:hypothetical protein